MVWHNLELTSAAYDRGVGLSDPKERVEYSLPSSLKVAML